MQKWENKVIASHVAEFEVPAPPPPPASYPPHPIHSQQQHHAYPMHNPYGQPPPPPPPPATMVKSEPVDSRHILNYHQQPMPHYTVPTLPGPPLRPPPTGQQPIQQQPYGAQAGRPGTSAPRPYSVTPNSYQQPPAATAQQATTARIPQVDGPSSSGSDSGSSPPQQYAPSRSHLPQPEQQPAAQADDEAINSDLDDSDSEGSEDPEEGGLGETDIVFCTYDKVRMPSVMTLSCPGIVDDRRFRSYRSHASRTSGSVSSRRA